MSFLGLFILLFGSFGYSAESETPTDTSTAIEKIERPAETENRTKKTILVPLIYYTPETQLAVGALVIRNFSKEREGRTSNILSAVSLTTKGQALLSVTPKFYFDKGHYELGSSFYASYYPNKFFGRGLANTLDKGENYTENTILLNLNGGVNLIADLYLRANFGYDRRKFLEWDPAGYVDAETQSYGANLEMPWVGFNLEWDERDFHQSPRSGSWFRLAGNFYDPHNLTGSAVLDPFQKYELDLRQYIVISSRNVLALQWLNSEVEGDRIPFMSLNFIGGGSRLRGFYAGRYREKAISLLQVENKYEWNDKWTAAFFAGIARLSADLATITDGEKSRLFSTAGFGLHYTLDTESRTKLRLDFGFGAKDLGVYFLLGEAF